MLHIKDNKKKIMELFFDFPLKNFYLREISRKTKVAITSVKRYVNEMVNEKIIIKVNKEIYPSFRSNREGDDLTFKFYKKLNMVERLQISGVLDYVEDKCGPKNIILFGSASRGEDSEGSDIDLFAQSKEINLNLSQFEKKLNREINIFFEKDFSKLSEELKNNILNGIILRGYLEVFWMEMIKTTKGFQESIKKLKLLIKDKLVD